MGLSRPLFLYFCLFDTFDNRFTNALLNNSPMTGFEPRASGVGSDSSTNWATPLPTYNLPIQSDFFRTNPSLNCFGGIWWFQQFCVETMQGVNFESITNLHHSGLRTEPAEITAEPSGRATFDTFRHFFNFSFISKSEMKQKMKRVSSTFYFEYFFQKNGHQLFFPEFLCPEVIFCVLQFRKKKKSNFLFVFRSNKIISFRVENSAVWIAQKWNLNYSNDDDVVVDDYFFKQKLLRLE